MDVLDQLQDLLRTMLGDFYTSKIRKIGYGPAKF